MSKPKKMLLTALIFLAVSPIESAIILVWMATSWWGIIFSLAAAFLIARFIEYQRMKRFSDINAAVFVLCAYGPGLLAAFIFCSVLMNMPKSPEDLNGWGALARGAIGIIVFISQLALAITGALLPLDAPRRRKNQHTQNRPEFPYTDNYFDDNNSL